MQEMVDEAGNVWRVDAQGNPIEYVPPQASNGIITKRADPYARPKAANEAAASEYEPAIKGQQLENAQYQQPNAIFNQKDKLRSDYNGMPDVKTYRVAIQQLAQALGTGEGSQADLALTYAFAKAMDPESVVRESEQGMVAGSQPWFKAAVEKVQKEYGVEGAGSFTPETRKALRAQIINSVNKRVKGYNQIRGQFADIAKGSSFNPDEIVGKHDADPFVPQFKAYDAQFSRANNSVGNESLEAVVAGNGSETPQGDIQTFEVVGPDGKKFTFTAPRTATDDEVRSLAVKATSIPAMTGSEIVGRGYEDSYAGQGLSGLNEGIASTLGAPVDIATAGLNLIPQGINAIANTNFPTIQNPTLGSEQIRGWMRDGGITFGETQDPTKQFARRVGQSVGAAAIPFGGGVANLGRQMLMGAGGGTGAATAQQLFPGNKWAEMAGEVIGGGAAATGIISNARRNATREIEAAVPTVPQLQEQAGNLYRQAETRGVTAGPSQTQQLRDDFEQTLRNEGQLGPMGRISDADTNTTKAFNLIDQYAGGQMRPVEMNTVRGVIADGRKSMDPSDQRLSGMLTEQFDDWARPMAPEFDEARDISSRYLQAQDLEEARSLAGARAGQFTGSGFENALRTEYRGLDRADIRGKSYFNPEVSEAIQRVSRGTPGSNLARATGRFAARGPMSAGFGIGAPAAVGGMVGGPAGAVAAGVTAGGIGEIGRSVATNMGIRNADIAELIARNGGRLPEAHVMTPEMMQMLTATASAEAAKYIPPKAKNRGIFGPKR